MNCSTTLSRTYLKPRTTAICVDTRFGLSFLFVIQILDFLHH